MRKKHGFAGWYHYSGADGFCGIEYLPEGPGDACNYGDYEHRQMAIGPFETFGEAKRDAIAYYQADITTARLNIDEIKTWKKLHSSFKGNKQR